MIKEEYGINNYVNNAMRTVLIKPVVTCPEHST